MPEWKQNYIVYLSITDPGFSPNSSLLTSTPNIDKQAMRCDAAAELDRLTKKKGLMSSPISSLLDETIIKPEPLDDDQELLTNHTEINSNHTEALSETNHTSETS